MRAQEFLDWVSKLSELSKPQLKDLRARLNLLDKMLPEQDWLIAGITHELMRIGQLTPMSIGAMQKTKGFAAYMRISEALRGQLEALLPDDNRNDIYRRALAEQVGRALIQWCSIRYEDVDGKWKTMKPRPGTVLINTQFTMEALNKCFPGYVKKEFMHLILPQIGRQP